MNPFSTRLLTIFGFLVTLSVFADEPAAVLAEPEPAIPPAPAAETAVPSSPDNPAPAAAPEPETPSAVAIDDADLPSPTANFEVYEEARLNRYRRLRIPRWSFNLTIEPRAFADTDFRKPTPTALPVGRVPTQVNPAMHGVLVSGERMLFRGAGVLAFGLEGGIYASKPEDGYEKLPLAMISAGPYLFYQLQLVERQFLVPIGRIEYESVMQNYAYEGGKNNAITQLLRADAGAMIYLNFMEPRSAGQMSANYGIKRTYLTATITTATDRAKKNIDLSERTWRAGFRFEY
ncbi:MAG: hypothetical protein HYW49_14080 [Deltaproteobacteria bacterium]|nr:hypothetical protein [Deltaproteobacteria bacterium]